MINLQTHCAAQMTVSEILRVCIQMLELTQREICPVSHLVLEAGPNAGCKQPPSSSPDPDPFSWSSLLIVRHNESRHCNSTSVHFYYIQVRLFSTLDRCVMSYVTFIVSENRKKQFTCLSHGTATETLIIKVSIQYGHVYLHCCLYRSCMQMWVHVKFFVGR